MTLTFDVEIPPGGFVDAEQRLEKLADDLMLTVTDRASKRAHQQLRQEMGGAGLGRLGNAIGHTSDLRKTGRVFIAGSTRRASGSLFIKTRNERTVGAIISYTEGAEIAPRRGRYLWIATDDLKRIVTTPNGRRRLSPSTWVEAGLNQKIGELFFIRGINGFPLAVVENVGVSAVGKPRSARSLTKSGRPRKGDRLKSLLVAFVAIPRTSRAARVNPRFIAAQAVREITAQLQGG